MTTIDQVTRHILQTPFYEDVLKKYLSNKEERNEFRQELWLILLEMPKEKLIDYYDRKCLQYIYIGIINNQIKSSTSPWHRNFRVTKELSLCVPNQNGDSSNNDLDIADHSDFEQVVADKTLFENKLTQIETILWELQHDDPHLKRDIDLFRIYYLQRLPFRKIADITKISNVSVWKYVTNVKRLVKERIKTTTKQ